MSFNLVMPEYSFNWQTKTHLNGRVSNCQNRVSMSIYEALVFSLLLFLQLSISVKILQTARNKHFFSIVKKWKYRKEVIEF